MNNNNFIGATHIDNIKITSNILEQHILINSINNSNYTSNASNILDTNSSNYTNVLRYDVNKWIGETSEQIPLIPGLYTTNTYITNSNIGGYIKFWTKDSEKVYTRINQNGKLQLYHDLDITKPNLSTKWYEVEDILMDYLFNMVILNAGAVATGVKFDIIDGQLQTQQGQILTLYDAIILLNVEVTQHDELIDYLYTELDFARYQYFNGLPDASTLVNAISQNIQQVSRVSSYIQNLFTTGVLIGAIGGAIGLIISNEREASRLHQLYNFINDPKSEARYLNSSDKTNLINQVNSSFSNNVFSYNSNLSNLGILNGFINSNIKTQQYISSLKSDTLDLNTGNITNINGISANEFIANGKIKQNGILLDNTYLTSNHLYNLTYNYTSERQYPSKLYTTSSVEDTVSLLGKSVYRQILYLDNSTTAYGNGFYEIYSSSTFNNGITNKDKLFNYNTSETTTSPRWAISLYQSGTGNYIGNNGIDGTYYGDWIIIKLAQPIMLTRYRIYQRSDFLTKAPSEWKVYGSNDGITFIQITEAHQLTRLTTYTGGFYEKTLAATFTTQYQYIGFVFNKLLSISGQTDLSFSELQIFGKEIISNNIVSNIYTTSNAVKGIVEFDMPIVCKHKAFYLSTSTVIYPDAGATPYYKYDLDLRNWTTTGYIQIGQGSNDPYRIFRIRCFFGSSYFNVRNFGMPDVLHYEIYMSNKAAAAGGGTTAGLNIYAIGVPESTSLNAILPNNIFLLRNDFNNFNYITIVTRQAADVRCIIEDLIS